MRKDAEKEEEKKRKKRERESEKKKKWHFIQMFNDWPAVERLTVNF